MCHTAGRSQTCVTMERRLLDCYELGDVIGEGGFGSVYAGTCRQNGDTVRIIACVFSTCKDSKRCSLQLNGVTLYPHHCAMSCIVHVCWGWHSTHIIVLRHVLCVYVGGDTLPTSLCYVMCCACNLGVMLYPHHCATSCIVHVHVCYPHHCATSCIVHVCWGWRSTHIIVLRHVLCMYVGGDALPTSLCYVMYCACMLGVTLYQHHCSTSCIVHVCWGWRSTHIIVLRHVLCMYVGDDALPTSLCYVMYCACMLGVTLYQHHCSTSCIVHVCWGWRSTHIIVLRHVLCMYVGGDALPTSLCYVMYCACMLGVTLYPHHCSTSCIVHVCWGWRSTHVIVLRHVLCVYVGGDTLPTSLCYVMYCACMLGVTLYPHHCSTSCIVHICWGWRSTHVIVLRHVLCVYVGGDTLPTSLCNVMYCACMLQVAVKIIPKSKVFSWSKVRHCRILPTHNVMYMVCVCVHAWFA